MAEKQPSETSSLLPTSVVNTSSTRDWKFGIVLVSLSGILHTANNFLVQFFEVDALELLLVGERLNGMIGLSLNARKFFIIGPV